MLPVRVRRPIGTVGSAADARSRRPEDGVMTIRRPRAVGRSHIRAEPHAGWVHDTIDGGQISQQFELVEAT